MFKLSEAAVKEHAEFGDRLYEIEDEKEKYILRYAAVINNLQLRRSTIMFQNKKNVWGSDEPYGISYTGELAYIKNNVDLTPEQKEKKKNF